jgi:alpha-L-fucosidase 2
MKRILSIILFVLIYSSQTVNAQSETHDLHFSNLPQRWDEAIPLGNGIIGALVWQNGHQLRFSLDRADLWDLRPMKGLHRPEFKFQWVVDQVNKNNYKQVQEYFDKPYAVEAAPSKIPGGALEFNTGNLGKVESVRLHLKDALCTVKWENGTVLKTFVHASRPIGWFRFEHLKIELIPQLIAPRYQGANNVDGDALSKLGYPRGRIKRNRNSITYNQRGWGGFNYEINVSWRTVGRGITEGVWSISKQQFGSKKKLPANWIAKKSLHHHFESDYLSHSRWWNKYWSKSTLQIPDTLIENQYYRDLYKFGAASRKGAPPISLQAIWTADDGFLPPWKGDYHFDLNTELSYWPGYTANHLDESMVFLDHLDLNKANFMRYTMTYYGKEGLCVPGVSTLDGNEMGGWIQFALSPTIACWLAHHYYQQWKYSMDKKFLRDRAYPWVRETAKFIENITIKDSSGHRKLPLSSSPEINDNKVSAWFHDNTNYDLALMKFSFFTAAEMAAKLGLKKQADHWKEVESEFNDFAVSPANELQFAPGMAYNQSHRHFSHMIAIYPLGLIKWENGEKSRAVIRNSIHLLDSIGPSAWCGYSYSWLANMKARAKDGDGAAKALEIFAKAFCSPNSFHLNGDQTKSGFSNSHDNSFTLEGNFAFAAGLQEMLIQSYAGFIEILPAVPSGWKNISFNNFRTEGAFLVSVRKTNGQITEVSIVSEVGGKTKLKLPFKAYKISERGQVTINKEDNNDFVDLNFKPGAAIVLKSIR